MAQVPIEEEPSLEPSPEPPLPSLTEERVNELIVLALGRFQNELEIQLGTILQGFVEQNTAAFLVIQEALNDLQRDTQTAFTQITALEVEKTEAANESGSGGVTGFFRRVGGFVASPILGVLDAVAGLFLDEVRDGLNR